MFWTWVAGLAGAVVVSLVDWRGPTQLLRMMIVGSISAVYLGDIAVPMVSAAIGVFSISPDKAVNLSGFLMGGLGIAFWEFIIEFWKARTEFYRRTPTPPSQTPGLGQDRGDIGDGLD